MAIMAITQAWVEEMAQRDRENRLPQAARLAIFYGCKPDIRPLKEDVLASASRIAAQRGIGRIDARTMQNVAISSGVKLGVLTALAK